MKGGSRMETTKICWSNDLGKLLLRLTVGGLMLCHGIFKITHGIDMIAGAVKSHNWPEFIAYGVYVGEVGAPALVLIGFWTRLAALVMAINMIVAVSLVHLEQIQTLNQGGGWALELQGMYFFGAICIMLLGAGRISIDGLLGGKREATTPPPEAK
jgi:putative oxidoreductase